jgi:transcriptional regulator GlxA family with amidase domain
MIIAILIYPGFTALDAIGPYEVLKYLDDVEIRFVWHSKGPVNTDRGILKCYATHTFDETPNPDIILVPGAEANTLIAASDNALLDWLRRCSVSATFTLSVCSGAIVLAAAGILTGRKATTHWAAMRFLKSFGATAMPQDRVVKDERVWTAAGVSAGIDLALSLALEIAGREKAEMIQLILEYDPQPPLASGHVSVASPWVITEASQTLKTLSARAGMSALAIKFLFIRARYLFRELTK